LHRLSRQLALAVLAAIVVGIVIVEYRFYEVLIEWYYAGKEVRALSIAFIIRQLLRPVWWLLIEILTLLTIGHSRMGMLRNFYRKPLHALNLLATRIWQQIPVVLQSPVSIVVILTVILAGLKIYLICLLLPFGAFIRKPFFWLGDRFFDDWTRPLKPRIRKFVFSPLRPWAWALKKTRHRLAFILQWLETKRELRKRPHHDEPPR
jgi:hypothetical protein